MEMMQFHPTGILAGNSIATGGLLEEGLRGAGARLYNALGERYMERYAPDKLERATRDVVARAGYMEIMAGRGTPERRRAPRRVPHQGRREALRRHGRPLPRVRLRSGERPRRSQPSAHYHMGGIVIDVNCHTNIDGLFAAGEDAGGVHGANRLGGNGVADSIVFGARAGDTMAEWVVGRPRPACVGARDAEGRGGGAARARLGRQPGRARSAPSGASMRDLMWEHVGPGPHRRPGSRRAAGPRRDRPRGSDAVGRARAAARTTWRGRRGSTPGTSSWPPGSSPAARSAARRAGARTTGATTRRPTTRAGWSTSGRAAERRARGVDGPGAARRGPAPPAAAPAPATVGDRRLRRHG